MISVWTSGLQALNILARNDPKFGLTFWIARILFVSLSRFLKYFWGVFMRRANGDLENFLKNPRITPCKSVYCNQSDVALFLNFCICLYLWYSKTPKTGLLASGGIPAELLCCPGLMEYAPKWSNIARLWSRIGLFKGKWSDFTL